MDPHPAGGEVLGHRGTQLAHRHRHRVDAGDGQHGFGHPAGEPLQQVEGLALGDPGDKGAQGAVVDRVLAGRIEVLEQQLQLVLRERQAQVRARLLEVAARDAPVAVEVELGERALEVERAAAQPARLLSKKKTQQRSAKVSIPWPYELV